MRCSFHFPHGNRITEFAAERSNATPAICDLTLRGYADLWLPRQRPPFVRAAQQRDYQRDVRVPLAVPITLGDGTKIALGDVPLVALAPRHLLELRNQLLRRRLALKSVRNMVDASFRAMVRDARSVDLLTVNDPFAALRWPRTAATLPRPVQRGRARPTHQLVSNATAPLLCVHRRAVSHRHTSVRTGGVAVG